MTLRVAYDITFLAEYAYRSGEEVGITRAVKSMIQELCRRKDVELTLMGLCGNDAAFHSHIAGRYYRGQQEGQCGAFAHTFGSRCGLASLYEWLYDVYLSKDFQSLPKIRPRSLFVRGALKALRTWDAYPAFDDRQFDVFHSTAVGLPPPHITKEVSRLLTIYDLIPLLAPQFVTPGQTEAMRSIIESIDINRDWVVCISEYTRQEFCEFTGMNPDRVFVTHLAADEHFRPVTDLARVAATRRRYGIPDGNYLLSLAAPQPRKNLAHLIACFFRLLADSPGLDANLVLVGPQGWMADEVFRAAQASSALRSRVVFTGYVAEEDLSAVYSGAKAFVYPSLYEGFGLPPLEAMRCGVPVITSNTTSLPEVVGEAGIMVGPADADALCQAMRDLLTCDSSRQSLRRKGSERSRHFSWARCADETVGVYRAITHDH